MYKVFKNLKKIQTSLKKAFILAYLPVYLAFLFRKERIETFELIKSLPVNYVVSSYDLKNTWKPFNTLFHYNKLTNFSCWIFTSHHKFLSGKYITQLFHFVITRYFILSTIFFSNFQQQPLVVKIYQNKKKRNTPPHNSRNIFL